MSDDLRAAAKRCGGRQIEASATEEHTAQVTFWVDVHDDDEARAIGNQVLDAVTDDSSYTVGIVRGWIG